MDRFEKAAREAGWTQKGTDWISPCGEFIESSAAAACAADNIEPPLFYSVAVYLVDRAYGGSEEGGWWYDCGTLAIEDVVEVAGNDGLPTLHIDLEEARKRKADMEVVIRQMNEGRPSTGSVLSVGRYEVQIHNEFPPKFFPETRPYYE